jgi:hypothetical protein
MSIPAWLKGTVADRGRIRGLSLRGLAACALAALLFSAGWSLSAGKQNQTQMIASACMDEAYAYFKARPELQFDGSEAFDDVIDGAGQRLIRCLQDTFKDTLSFPDPDQ